MTQRTARMYQSWRDLLFLHWPVDPATIQSTLPPGLTADCHQGVSYLGVVPFIMHGLRPRFLPPCPGISYFPELNLRTYVRDASGRPGVWFYSLDAQSRISVAIAQRFFHLPYVYAKMGSSRKADGSIHFRAARTGQPTQVLTYRPTQKLGTATPSSLEHFLVERYRLFAYDAKKKQLHMGELSHSPYVLHEAEVSNYSTDLFGLNGFEAPKAEPCHAVYSAGVRVEVYDMQRIPFDG